MNFARKLFIIVFLALASILISYFAKANDLQVDLNLFFYRFASVQLWLVVLFSFLGGVLFTVLILFFEIIKSNVSERKLKRKTRKLEKELAELRNRSIADVDEERDVTDSADLPDTTSPVLSLPDNDGDIPVSDDEPDDLSSSERRENDRDPGGTQ